MGGGAEADGGQNGGQKDTPPPPAAGVRSKGPRDENEEAKVDEQRKDEDDGRQAEAAPSASDVLSVIDLTSDEEVETIASLQQRLVSGSNVYISCM